MLSALALAAALLICAAMPAHAGEPPVDPVLRMETGTHSAMIWRIGMDATGTYLVTASDDKTARVWEVATGRLLQTLRPPIGMGHEGKLYYAAMSPDGEYVATGGWTGYDWDSTNSLYIFERSSGRMIKRITGLPIMVHMTWSPRGDYFAAMTEEGLKVFDGRSFELIFEDIYSRRGNGCDFDSHGRLVTVCLDGSIRLYDSSLRLVAQTYGYNGREPFSADFSPDGTSIAIGYQDAPAVDVISGRDLSFMHTMDTTGVDNGEVQSVQWSADGRTLYAGGTYLQGGVTPILRWDGPNAAYQVIEASTLTVIQILALPNGDMVYASHDPSWGVINGYTSEISVFQRAPNADFRDNYDGFLLNPDGTEVVFGYKLYGAEPARFSIQDRELIPGPLTEGEGFTPPILEAPGLVVTNWKHRPNPAVNGRPIEMSQFEISRAVALMPDSSGFALGTEYNVRFFDREGNEQWSAQAPGVCWAVNIAANGKVLVAAFVDGTIRWYRISDGQEMLALFPHSDQRRWVMWTESGYYDASAGAEDMLGWHINRGKDQEADFFPLSRFREVYYRPDVLSQLLVTLDEDSALQMADAERGEASQGEHGKIQGLRGVRDMLPPVVTIISPQDGSQVSETSVTLRFSVRSPGGEDITGVRVLINGRPEPSARGFEVAGPEARDGVDQEITVSIPPADVELGVIAENEHGASEPALISVAWAGDTPQEDFVIKPKLYVLAVGVSDYENNDLDLLYAAKDAQDFTTLMAGQAGGLYREVETHILLDADATKDNILDGLEWIERQTTQHDVAVLFLAGHGVNDSAGDYYYLPANTDLDRLRRTGLPFTEVRKTLSSLAGKALFFVDTCHSGNILGSRRGQADINAVVNELSSAENGAVVFSSSTGNQYSLEDPAWENGAFTLALVEALSGSADFMGTGRITINMIDLYMSERVKELTRGEQTPTTTKPETVPDFPVALIQ